MPQLVCQCGGIVPRPLPVHCPHCGKVISGVRQPRGAQVWPLVAVAATFGLLVLGLVLLLRWFGG